MVTRKERPSRKTNRPDIESLASERGLKMTGQRKVIVKVLAQSPDHPDVEKVHKRAHRLDPKISLATVYRTLKLLEENGILTRHDFGAGRSRYEASDAIHHDHLIDVTTGNVIEFTNEDIEKLQEAVAQKLGYRLIGHKLELYARPIKEPKRKTEND